MSIKNCEPYFSFVAGAENTGAPGAPTGLLAEYTSNPPAIDVFSPGFSWVVNHASRGEQQTAYQIIVASDEENIRKDFGDQWDSGKVISSECTNVRYQGNEFSSNTRYWWKVRVWDSSDGASEYSNYATFDTGLLKDDWTANFIWDGTINRNNHCCLRKKFNIPTAVKIAKAYVSAHSGYKLYINGVFIGKGPATCDPFDTELYNSYDITSALSYGDNVISVIAYYHGGGGAGVKGEPAFIFQSEITFVDLTTITIKSDETWKVMKTTPWNETSPDRGPYEAPGVLVAATTVEDYDARLEIPEWKNVTFDDSSWANATVVKPSYKLKAQLLPMEEVEEIIVPICVTQPSKGIYLVDFGRNCTGWPIITINGSPAGNIITVWYSEVKSGDRIGRNRLGISDYYDSYITKGGEMEIWEPDTNYKGFRFVEIEGYPGSFNDNNIQLKYTHTKLIKAGNFNCSNPLINNIYSISVQTQKNCVQGLFSDCPTREQSQYIADTFIQAFNLFYNFENFNIVRKCIYDFRASKLDSGNLRSHYPSESIQQIPEWTLHWVLLLWLQYFYFNDREILMEMYPTVKEILNYFSDFVNPDTGLLENTPGWEISDWPYWGGFPDGSVTKMETDGSSLTPQNCLYYKVLKTSAEIAGILGYKKDACDYCGQVNDVKTGINKHLFDGISKYRDCIGSSQYKIMASILPLYFDIVPEDKKQAVLDYIKSKGFEPQVYGGFYLCDMLYKHNQSEHVYNIINQTDSLWGKMVRLGETTTWEGWDGEESRCHAWSAYPMKFLLSGVIGIEPTGVGFSTFNIKPGTDGGLTFAEGSVPTIKGNIAVRWDKTVDGMTLIAVIPANTLARVYIPKPTIENILIKERNSVIWDNGTYLEGAAGVSYNGVTPDFIIFNVGSGTYKFSLSKADNQ